MKLIDGDALMEALGIAVECKDCSRNGAFGCKEDSAFVYACEAITDAPTIDAVEVVRCEYCEYSHEEDEFERWCYGFGSPARLVRKDDFCSHGKRR